LLLICLVFGAGIIAHYLLDSTGVPKTSKTARSKGPSPHQKKDLHTKKSYTIPKYEIYPKGEIPVQRLVRGKGIVSQESLPRVAIIVDDVGYDKNIAEELFAHAAHKKNFDIMLHLPMEPKEYPSVKPGPGGLLSSMPPDQLLDQLHRNINNIPHVKGVNNHMGSRLTTVSSQMNQVFSVLKKKELFFIDSRTTADTLCYQSARLLQVPFAERSVFLDHVPESDFIRRQLKKLVQDAVNHGEAVGIAHPHMVTYRVLREEMSELKKKVMLVPASTIVHTIDR